MNTPIKGAQQIKYGIEGWHNVKYVRYQGVFSVESVVTLTNVTALVGTSCAPVGTSEIESMCSSPSVT